MSAKFVVDKIELTTSALVKSISVVADFRAIASASEATAPLEPPPAAVIKVATFTPAEYNPVCKLAIGSIDKSAVVEIPKPVLTAVSAAA